MDKIQNNPHRVSGILSGASMREVTKAKRNIRLASIGKIVNSEYDFIFLNKIHRTENSLNKAFSEIEQNNGKVNHSFFWFSKGNSFDETAIEYLIQGNQIKALEIWEKVTSGRAISARNFSSFNNISTLKLLSNNANTVKEGIESKFSLIESDFLSDFVHLVADETATVKFEKQVESLIIDLLSALKNQYSSTQIFNLFNGCSEIVRNSLSKKFTQEPLHNIESQIESAKSKRKNNSGNAYEYGLKLFQGCKEDLALLKSILGTNDLKYKMTADSLANEIMQCGIDYFNENQENDSSEDFLKQAQKLNEIALSIAIGKLVRDRAKDHISTLEKMKDHEVIQAILLLQSVKDAYETNEKKIRRQVEELIKNDIEIRTGLKSINQSAVKDNIRNSIDWNKVNDLLRDVLSNDNLEKIKASSNNEFKSEFKELVHWLKEYSQSNSFITRIIKNYKKIPPRLPFKIISSEITNTDDKPLYNKYIRHIGLKLYIEVMEDSDVTFYLKYIDSKGEYKYNSRSSPDGYTYSETHTISKSIKLIKFSDWGSTDKCSYDIGEHLIEVYIDEHLIYTRKFNVNLAPSEKIGKKLSDAKKKLNQINQINYYSTEIKDAQDEMSEIQKFKWFRWGSEKENQIKLQQAKIEKLIENSKNKKNTDIKIQKEKIYKLKTELSLAKH